MDFLKKFTKLERIFEYIVYPIYRPNAWKSLHEWYF